uniref:Palmitoyltransferase n=1 Tax=Timema douglasi TaxID=61478 RepID=A0A7R8ZCA7_TIMDO|nr:unnamed protein product [Timema douglasi]
MMACASRKLPDYFVCDFNDKFFVFSVCGLTASVIVIAYWIGLPYWWNKSPMTTVALLLVGHWLLVNICFHYYMAASTLPGYPPEDTLIPEAASICKKCIAPKPPRTHHCSVCNKCILKMDHHCPWLNNCIGHYNHRYFFLYMVYMVLGVFFLMVFGFELAYTEVWLNSDQEEELEGHSVRFNNSVLIRVPEVGENASHFEEPPPPREQRTMRQTCIIYMAFINFGFFFVNFKYAMSMLPSWVGEEPPHEPGGFGVAAAVVLSRRASICPNLSSLAAIEVYENPYNFGRKKNWRIFLGLVRGRTWRHVVFPSNHKPVGIGLTWDTVHSDSEGESDKYRVC